MKFSTNLRENLKFFYRYKIKIRDIKNPFSHNYENGFFCGVL